MHPVKLNFNPELTRCHIRNHMCNVHIISPNCHVLHLLELCHTVWSWQWRCFANDARQEQAGILDTITSSTSFPCQWGYRFRYSSNCRFQHRRCRSSRNSTLELQGVHCAQETMICMEASEGEWNSKTAALTFSFHIFFLYFVGIISPKWNRKLWKSGFFTKQAIIKKFNVKSFRGSTHEILSHSRFHICV